VPEFDECVKTINNWEKYIQNLLPIQMVIQKGSTTKLKYLKETHTVTGIIIDSEKGYCMFQNTIETQLWAVKQNPPKRPYKNHFLSIYSMLRSSNPNN
jgi:hypothetical protein